MSTQSAGTFDPFPIMLLDLISPYSTDIQGDVVQMKSHCEHYPALIKSSLNEPRMSFVKQELVSIILVGGMHACLFPQLAWGDDADARLRRSNDDPWYCVVSSLNDHLS